MTLGEKSTRLTNKLLASGDKFIFEEFGIEAADVEAVFAEAENQDTTVNETTDANTVGTDIVPEMTITARRSKLCSDIGASNEGQERQVEKKRRGKAKSKG